MKSKLFKKIFGLSQTKDWLNSNFEIAQANLKEIEIFFAPLRWWEIKWYTKRENRVRYKIAEVAILV